MTHHPYDREITALLVIDPYNDFISKRGNPWGRIRAVAEANGCVPHMLQILNAPRARQNLRVFYAMHHRYRRGDHQHRGQLERKLVCQSKPGDVP
ncbi:hypothetical protein [Bradyrhizobium sp.]|uniref:hypothetical protein n=1 Tax=Bradyrhizobium sp. TaxID=376 RepID=UPI003C6F8D76